MSIKYTDLKYLYWIQVKTEKFTEKYFNKRK